MIRTGDFKGADVLHKGKAKEGFRSQKQSTCRTIGQERSPRVTEPFSSIL